jgi:hypothetical protein
MNSFINSLKEDFENGLYEAPETSDSYSGDEKEKQNHNSTLQKIFSRFHTVVKALRRRHNGRSILGVNDEYDVQDLLNSLLLVEFEDVRREEWIPSYVGTVFTCRFLIKKRENCH